MEGQVRRRIDGLVNIRHEVDLATLITRIIIDLKAEGIDPEDTIDWLKIRIGEIYSNSQPKEQRQ